MNAKKTEHKVRKGYDPAIPSRLACPVESRTLQSHRDDCDINNIMRLWKKTGVITHGSTKPPLYGDLMDVPDYQEMLNQTIAAQDAFDALPAEVRKAFDNSPGKFINDINNPEHTELRKKLGVTHADEKTEAKDEGSPIAPPSQPLGQPDPAPEAATVPPAAG